METVKKTRKTRESNYVNITDSILKSEIKELVTLPNKDLQLNYVIWYKKAEPTNWGLTIKGFPEKKHGVQHVFKITWCNNESNLVPESYCGTQTEQISGDAYNKILNIYNKYKK